MPLCIVVDVSGLAIFLFVCVDVRFVRVFFPALMSRQLAFLGFGQLCCVYIFVFDSCATAWVFHCFEFVCALARLYWHNELHRFKDLSGFWTQQVKVMGCGFLRAPYHMTRKAPDVSL